MKSLSAFTAILVAALTPAFASSDGVLLQNHVRSAYPSLLYVEKYRTTFPDEVQGTTTFWSAKSAVPDVSHADALVATLTELQDPHVSLAGPRAGKAETLGVLFRTASDGSIVVWRVFDPTNHLVKAGDRVLAIDGADARAWLQRAASLTFGGNRRGRYAEAALDLGLGTAVVHRTARAGNVVRLLVQAPGHAPKTVALAYEPMNAARARALTVALNQPDLPEIIVSGRIRIGTLRIGAFAPQYDPLFLEASDRASKLPGITDDQAMQAGYCAVTRDFIKRFDSVARRADVVVLDLRGNLGGFDREARLEAASIAPSTPARAFDLFATRTPGIVQLTAQTIDPSCGHASIRRPIVVLVDAGTRSSVELTAAWLWTSGATIAGEHTAGADGGLDSAAKGFPLPASGFNVRMSGNFTIFDPTLQLSEGDWPERAIVAQVSADRFAQSRQRPFAFQSVGLRPDIAVRTALSDLRDGGVAEVAFVAGKLGLRPAP
jgi:C-terminal processing protease CtpA/Prc